MVTTTSSEEEQHERTGRTDRNADGSPMDNWSVEGAALRGKLHESYEEEGTFDPPTFVVTVRSAHGDEESYRTPPIYLPGKKTQALELRDLTAEWLQS